MTLVRTGSRLHFGLLSIPSSDPPAPRWRDLEGAEVVPARSFGGVGLMVQAPGLCVRTEPAAVWSAEGPLAERALVCARAFSRTLPACTQPHRIVIEHSAPEHAGLGTGTQLALTVARALALSCGAAGLSAVELAQRVGRGARSALGIHGFAQGGFLVEGGKGRVESVAPLVARLDFPEAWRVVLVLPHWGKGLHDQAEARAFLELHGQPAVQATDALCRLVLLGMLPALIEADLEAFGEALHDFNRRVGEAFRSVQGGTYAHRRTEEVVAFVRRQGVHGVGQSSWGPAVFAVVDDQEKAVDLARRIREQFALTEDQAFPTGAYNRGAIECQA